MAAAILLPPFLPRAMIYGAQSLSIISSLLSTTFTKPTGTPIISAGDSLPARIRLSMEISAVGAFPIAKIHGFVISAAFSIDTSAFANAFQVNMSSNDLTDIMMSMRTTEERTYENNLKNFGYADLNKPYEVSIYPISFESKEKVIDVLDQYNAQMKQVDENKVITYTDLVGLLMTSVTNIVDMISMVLIAFVAISLIVSSIMIGVITYISVLERIKEIGILRAIGASKKDISHVFNAETIIEGLVAGLLGVGVTAIACAIANVVLVANDYPAVAQLPANAAVILVLISVVLTFIAGLLPARSASKKDPVEALRSE